MKMIEVLDITHNACCPNYLKFFFQSLKSTAFRPFYIFSLE